MTGKLAAVLIFAAVVGGAITAYRFLGTGQHAAAPGTTPLATVTAAPRATATPITVSFESSENRGMAGVGWDIGPRPDSPFPAWNGREAVIYDTKAQVALDLGEGTGVIFSDDSKYAAWLAAPLEYSSGAFSNFPTQGEAKIVTLATGEQRSMGPASALLFVEGDRIALAAPRTPTENTKWTLFDTATLQRSADQTTQGQQSLERHTSTGQLLQATPVAGTEIPRGGYGLTHFRLIDADDRHPVMEFDAFAVADADSTHLVVARTVGELPKNPFVSLPVSIYLLDVTNGSGNWIGGARASSPNWNLSANERWVLWTNDFCSEEAPGPEVVLLDRSGGQGIRGYAGSARGALRVESSEAWMFLAPNGLIAQGTFGATALLDPVTFHYVVTLPPMQLPPELSGQSPQARWSKDYRYATYYFAGGHGGLC
jgi:hypothetical protein